MKDYKSTGHAIYDCKYHIVRITKYRYAVLGGEKGMRVRELIREISKRYDMRIYAGSVNRDHIHLLIGIPPYISVSKAVQYLKGYTSHKLQIEFPDLKRRYWGQHLRARGYRVATTGNVTDEVRQKYIENQSVEEPDDDFRVL